MSLYSLLAACKMGTLSWWIALEFLPNKDRVTANNCVTEQLPQATCEQKYCVSGPTEGSGVDHTNVGIYWHFTTITLHHSKHFLLVQLMHQTNNCLQFLGEIAILWCSRVFESTFRGYDLVWRQWVFLSQGGSMIYSLGFQCKKANFPVRDPLNLRSTKFHQFWIKCLFLAP